MKTIEQAREILFDRFSHLELSTQAIKTVDAQGRVLANPAFSRLSSPNFHAAAMDGIAVKAKDTFGANDDAPVCLTPGKNAFWINTGHVMPEETNAVIMIENLQVEEDERILIEAPVFPWQNVRKVGEDIVATELLFPRHHQVNAYSIGALLSGGVFEVEVFCRPEVLIIPTGSELVTWQTAASEPLKPGDVIESNASVLAAMCRECGAVPTIHSMLKDDVATIEKAVSEACKGDADMVLIIGGSSAGSKDFAKPVIEALGTLYLHGVTMMPGKPVMFGQVENVPVFGIPGYPVSAIVAFEQLTGPLLSKMQKLEEKKRQIEDVLPARKMASKLGQEEFLRVKLGSVDGRMIASQLPRGAGNITSLTEADAVIRIPKNIEGLAEDKAVPAELLKSVETIENTIVIIGSHDNTLDLLADQIRLQDPGVGISSNHVGSMGGLMAIRKNACHVAGIHLLDPEDGTYNHSYVKKYLPDQKIILVNLAMRDQGLIIQKGNPRKIKSIEDLRGTELKFINRQPGSGTRILLDYKLKMLGISADQILGYENDEYTHMSVAVSVLSGRADAGLGIYAAARALDLDFIPVVTESYDLAIPARHYETQKVQILLETIRSESFKKQVMALGGYHTQNTGNEITIS